MRQYKTTPEERARAAAYRQTHKSEYQAYFRRYNRENAAKRAAGQRKTNYGLSADLFAELVQAQDGRCANPRCRVVLTMDKSTTGAAVDHDHACCPGKKSCGTCIRGLLCQRCNSALGYAADDVERLRGLVDYLAAYKPKRKSQLSLWSEGDDAGTGE